MDDPAGRQIVKSLGGRDYKALSLAVLTEYVKHLSAEQKEITMMEIDFEKHSALALILLKEYKPASHLLYMPKLLMEFSVEQLLHFSQFKDLCQIAVEYSESMLENGTAIKLVRALKVAVEKINNYEKGHTALHTIFIKLCIQTKNYKAAVSVVEKPMTNIAKSFEIDHSDHLTYLLYASFVFIALERYDEAIKNLKLSLQLGGRDLNVACIEARKKLILLLLRKGDPEKILRKFPILAKDPSAMRLKPEKESESIYNKLLESDILRTIPSYEKFIQTNEKELSQDLNFGLAKIVKDGIYWKKIKVLQSAYIQYKLSDLTKEFELQQNQNIKILLLRVLKIKQIGKIDSFKNTISFERPDDPYKIDLLKRLHTATAMIRELALQYNTEHLGIIRDRIAMPNTIFS